MTESLRVSSRFTLDSLWPCMEESQIKSNLGWTSEGERTYMFKQKTTPSTALVSHDGKACYRVITDPNSPNMVYPIAVIANGCVERILGRNFASNGETVWRVGDDWTSVHDRLKLDGYSSTGSEWKLGKFVAKPLKLALHFEENLIACISWSH